MHVSKQALAKWMDNAWMYACRSHQDLEGADKDGPQWHSRQSKEERLADAAESRLLGLAARPKAALESKQQDLEPRQQQPMSHPRRDLQVYTTFSQAVIC